MATVNPFDLLGDDAEDPSQRIAAEQLMVVAAPKKPLPTQTKPAQLPTKPTPPTQAVVREARNETSRGGRGGGRGSGRGYGRGGGGYFSDSTNDENSFTAPAGETVALNAETGKPSDRFGYGGSHGGRGGFSNGEGGEEGRPGRAFESRSGTGRGNDFKRDGAGRGNWGTQADEFAQTTEEVNGTTKNLADEKPSGEEDVAADGNKESPAAEAKEVEPEDKEMTLEEYEQVLEEKRNALQAIETEQRKVDAKAFESVQQISSKKDNDDIFVKLGSENDKRKESLEKEEKSKKSVSINEFLKPAEGESYYNLGECGRGHGHGRGARGVPNNMSNFTLISSTVETSDGVKLHTRLFKPGAGVVSNDDLAIVLVHPYSILGGSQGLLRGIASGLAHNGYKAVTFDMRGVGKSTGNPSLTGFAEIKDIIAVCKWLSDTHSVRRILLVGSSAGAPIAGSAVDQIEQVIGYVSIGYPFGMTASILFGRHHKAILRSPKPKLFIMGTKDGFTSVKQLKNKLSSAAGCVETRLIEGAGHFEMEGSSYDTLMTDLIIKFIMSI